MCCLLEVIWRGHGAKIPGMKGRRYKLWWSGKGDGVGGVRVIVMEKMCNKVIEVRKVIYKVMTVAVFEEEVLRLICGYAPQSGKSLLKKQYFYD